MKKLILVLSAVLLLAGCSTSSTSSDLTSTEFSNKVTESGVITLDVRTPGEFMAGHIQGAINIDVEGTEFETEIAKLDKTQTYAIYCQSGRRSSIAVETMQSAGFNKLFNLTNGIQDWQAQNLPIVTS